MSALIPVYPGERYGQLTVLSITRKARPSRPNGVLAALAQCDCGAVTTVATGDLRHGRVISCGCQGLAAVTRHGLRWHPLYPIWLAAVQRCENPKSPSYKRYGARGIRVSSELRDPQKFIDYIEANLGPRPEGVGKAGRALYELDRIDANGHYEPGNLRWATKDQQRANGRKTRGTSRYKGVGKFGPYRWRARITVGGKERHLGFFGSEIEAARAYDAAALEAWGEFARINFPQGRASA